MLFDTVPKQWKITLLIITCFIVSGCTIKAIPAATPSVIATTQTIFQDIPTLAEFGRDTCVPCKEMRPILEKLAEEYEGKLRVAIINIDDHKTLTSQNNILAIPTQICFDENGVEVYRHIGFWPEEEIIAQLKAMGIE